VGNEEAWQAEPAAQVPVTHANDPLANFRSTLADNLSGRRVLDRADPGLEPEPATFGQLAPMARIHEGLRRLRTSGHFAADAADQAAIGLVTALVDEAAADSQRHVASWDSARRALAALADLVDALDADPRPARQPAATE
jgi:hypothetical protein